MSCMHVTVFQHRKARNSLRPTLTVEEVVRYEMGPPPNLTGSLAQIAWRSISMRECRLCTPLTPLAPVCSSGTGRSGGGSQSPCPRKSAAGEQPSILERAAEPGAGARGSSAGDSSRQYMREPARRHVAVHHPSDFFPLGECMHKPARRHVAVLHPSKTSRKKMDNWRVVHIERATPRDIAGRLAQMVERSLSMREAPGSIPGFSRKRTNTSVT